MSKLKVLVIILGIFFASLATIGRADNAVRIDDYNDERVYLSEKNLQRFATVIAAIKKYYYKAVTEDKLFIGAISGMLSNLDPHSSYLGLDDLHDLEMATTGKFGGIGVEIVPEHGAIKVISPLDDTPAYKVGIKAGDYIIQIDNKLVRDMTLREAVSMMRGRRGTKLQLTILRKDEARPLVFNLKREIIKVKTVKSKMLIPGYGYLRIALFQEPTEKDVKRVIAAMQKKAKGGLKGLVLDMRNNPGGLFEASVDVANNFLDAKNLKSNDLIVYTKGLDETAQLTAKVKPGELLPGVPIVVLINEGSASAAEIVAGALQDHKRAIIVGERSFGKGSVQTLIPIDGKSAIKLTTALYYTPLGHSIQAKGIEPDIVVADIMLSKKDGEDKQEIPRIDEEALIDHIQNGNEENSSDKNVEDKKIKDISGNLTQKQKQTKEELGLAYKDYQLYEALHILKSQNVMRGRM